MIELDLYGAGLVTGASVMLMLAIGALTLQRRELRRVRKRLNGICALARKQNETWRGTTDWEDLVNEISPYEEA
jgi:hypothetical protein